MTNILGITVGPTSAASTDAVNLNLSPILNVGLGGSLLTSSASTDPLLTLDVGSSLVSAIAPPGSIVGGVLGSGGIDGSGDVLSGLSGEIGGATTTAGSVVGSTVHGVLGGLGDLVTTSGGVVTTVGQVLSGLGTTVGTIGTGIGSIGSGSGGGMGPGTGPTGVSPNAPEGTASSGVTIFHSPNGDIFIGTPGSDTMTGGAGNDHFYGLGGNDTIDGGLGYDTAFYQGARADYTGSLSGGVLTLKDNVSGRDGTDTLTNVERISFTDSTVAFDINGDAGQAYRIYQAAFDRTPDQHGLSYWVTQMDHGETLTAVANEFLASPEFAQKYGTNLTNDQLVNDLYTNVLGRSADSNGLQYWDNALKSGESRAQVLAAFSESAENHANVDPHLAQGILLDAGVYV